MADTDLKRLLCSERHIDALGLLIPRSLSLNDEITVVLDAAKRELRNVNLHLNIFSDVFPVMLQRVSWWFLGVFDLDDV